MKKRGWVVFVAVMCVVMALNSATFASSSGTSGEVNHEEYQELCYGMENDDVKAMQNRLRELGYSVSNSGGYWENTKNAVEAFQRTAGLPVDGKTATPYMLAILFSSDAPHADGTGYVPLIPTPEPTSTPMPYQTLTYGMENNSLVKAMQERLRELGYFSETPTGNYYVQTRRAVAAFEKDRGNIVDGRTVSAELLSIILTGSATPPYQVLTYGMENNASVKAMQTRLQELRFFNSNPTGNYYSVTASAVEAFQKAAGLVIDGRVASIELQYIIYSSSAPNAYSSAETDSELRYNMENNDQVRLMQRRLADLGYLDSRYITGSYYIITARAVEAFQQAAGLPVNGRVATPEMLQLLYSDDAPTSGDLPLSNVSWHLDENGLLTISGPGMICDYFYFNYFPSSDAITKIIIEDGITGIDDYVFDNCNLLEKAYLPRSVTTFGENIFSNTPTIYCYEESDADFWAYANGYPTVYLDSVDVDTIRTVTLPADFALPCGESRAIPASVFPTHDDPAVVWTSSNPDAVSIDENGLATALAPGEAVITARVGGVSASVTVTAYREPEAFELSDAEIWVFAKTTTPLSIASVTPEDADLDLTWISSDESVATVDETGLVRALKPGDATITAVSNDIARHCVVHSCYSVSAIAFEEDAVRLIAGVPRQLTARVTMNTQQCVNHLVTFASSDERVATVDEHGIVTPHAAGTAQITASPMKGTASPAVCAVTVADRDGALTMRLPAAATGVEAEAFAGTAADVYALPASVDVIGPRAFADLTRPALVILPATGSVDIADDAFEGSAVTIECPAGSPVEAWAMVKGIPTVNP